MRAEITFEGETVIFEEDAFTVNISGGVGPQGLKGDKGDKGDPGDKGDTGEQGPQGRTDIPLSSQPLSQAQPPRYIPTA